MHNYGNGESKKTDSQVETDMEAGLYGSYVGIIGTEQGTEKQMETIIGLELVSIG